jgi:hypothetical protein
MALITSKQLFVFAAGLQQLAATLLCISPFPGAAGIPGQLHPTVYGLKLLQDTQPDTTSYTKADYFIRTNFLWQSQLTQRFFVSNLTLSSKKSMAILPQKDKNVK